MCLNIIYLRQGGLCSLYGEYSISLSDDKFPIIITTNTNRMKKIYNSIKTL